MKICLISEEYPPETGWGGIGTHTLNLAHALVDLGHKVQVLSKSVDGKLHTMEQGALTVYRLPERPVAPDYLLAALRKVSSARVLSSFDEYPLRAFRRSSAVMEWLVRHPGYDIIEAPDYGAETFRCQMFSRTGAPLVVKLHTPLFLTQRLNGTPSEDSAVTLRKWMERYCIINATKIISPTRSLANIISDEFKIDGIEVLPNCIDTDFFSFKPKEPHGDFTFMYAGRLERRKGVEVLAQAVPLILKEVPHARFRLVGRDTPTAEGGGSMLEWMKEHFLRENVADRVEFVGEIPRSGIVPYFQQADACILPSLWENLPYTCLESMACGTPVVASRCGGFPEIISEGADGLLFGSGDPAELAAKAAEIALHSDVAAMGKRARQAIEERFGQRVVAERTVELYRKVING